MVSRVKKLGEQLRELYRASRSTEDIVRPWERLVRGLVESSGGSFTRRGSGWDAQATIGPASAPVEVKIELGTAISISATADVRVPARVCAVRRSWRSPFAKASEIRIGDEAFDAAFRVEAPNVSAATSLLDPPLRAALFALRLGGLSYDAGDVKVWWHPTASHDTSAFDDALAAVIRARAWRVESAPYR